MEVERLNMGKHLADFRPLGLVVLLFVTIVTGACTGDPINGLSQTHDRSSDEGKPSLNQGEDSRTKTNEPETINLPFYEVTHITPPPLHPPLPQMMTLEKLRDGRREGQYGKPLYHTWPIAEGISTFEVTPPLQWPEALIIDSGQDIILDLAARPRNTTGESVGV